MRFDELLKEKRKETGLSIRDVAKAIGVTTGTYYAWEKFINIPSKANIRKIKNILGVDVSESANIERAKRSKRAIIVSKTNVIAQLIVNERIRRGMSISEACKTYKVGKHIWGRWEQSDSMNYSDREIEVISEFTGKSERELWSMRNPRRWKNNPKKWSELLWALNQEDYEKAAEIGRKYF